MNNMSRQLLLSQRKKTCNWLILFTLLCAIIIWFPLAFWLIFNPPTDYFKSYCDEVVLYSSRTSNEKNENPLFKMEKHFQKFNQLTSLYGDHFNVSSDKIKSVSHDANVYFITYRVINDEDLNEDDRMFVRRNYFEYDTSSKKYDQAEITSANNEDLLIHHIEKKQLKEPNKDRITSSFRLSANNKYLLHDKIALGEKYDEISKSNEVTLTTQSSLVRLSSFVFSASKWTGPISLAVFVHESDEYFIFKKYLQYLKRCQPSIYNRTCFSLAIPKGISFVEHETSTYGHLNTTSCTIFEDIINTEFKKSSNTSKQRSHGYPQNTMRNLAKHNIITPYHLMLDIDIIPSPNMSICLNKFFKDKPIFKNGLVIPTYEISQDAKFPENKAELMNLRITEQAEPFYANVSALSQNSTNFPRWEKINDTFDDVRIVYEISKFLLRYEPFFVEHYSSPLYNENFIGHDFARSSHAYEIYLKNGNFQVLSPVFTIHLDFQKHELWSWEGRIQNAYNNFVFLQFLVNLHNKTNFETIVGMES